MTAALRNRAANGAVAPRKVMLTLPRLRTVPASLMLRDDVRVHQAVLNNNLLMAAGRGLAFEMERYLNLGAEPDVVDLHRNTSLHHLSARGLSRIAERLIDPWNATINLRNNMGYTSLDLCSAAGRMSTVKMFLPRYPRTEASRAEFGKAAKVAEEYGQVEIAKLLRRAVDEGIGFLRIGYLAPARTVSSP